MLSNQGSEQQRYWRLRAGLVALLAGLLMAGCGGGSVAPVSDRSLGARPPPVVKSGAPSSYRVRSGDTLYSIAWRYGKDFRGLARANHIDHGYRIYPGQRLTLTEAPPPRPVATPTRATPTPAKPTPRRSAPAAKPTHRTTPAAPKPDWQPVKARALTWRWPARGAVISGFRARGKLNKGLDIAGRRGDSVQAAAPGEVVYAGNGLLGYGNLIIINHNEDYLSAYAHNSKLLVKEKDWVKTGEKIAEIGDSGATRTMLHFEIRKDGKPVDPLRYLPKRQ